MEEVGLPQVGGGLLLEVRPGQTHSTADTQGGNESALEQRRGYKVVVVVFFSCFFFYPGKGSTSDESKIQPVHIFDLPFFTDGLGPVFNMISKI